jgi:penicillin-binding protein 1C
MNKKRICWIGILLISAVIVLVISTFVPLPQSDFSKESIQSLRIVDRNEIVLREFLNDQQGRGEWKPLSAIAPSMQQATISVEDKRFNYHIGIDPIAIVRSVVENIKAFRFKSGGSTLTQQVIRNIYHRPRTLLSKLIELWDALRLERMLSKQDILEQYLNRAPYGNQIFGIEAASFWYFGKSASDLSIAESAFLAALPNAPSLLNPHKNINSTLARTQSVLRRMLEQNKISKEEYNRAIVQPIQLIPPETHFKAPHVSEMIKDLYPGIVNGTIKTTIDYLLQGQIQYLMRGHLKKLIKKNVHNAAVVVIENKTGEIRALVGSVDFFDSLHHGQVNGVTALRQPGSAIKPFMYALTLEHGLTPASLLADIPTAIPDHHGDYVPENYDKHFHGPVRLRTALACSYNVPAVRALQTIGKSALLEKLRDVGCSSLDKDAEYYGYGLTLGNAEVTLLELTTAYMSLANGGRWKPSALLPGKSMLDNIHKVYNEQTAYLITDILKDEIARRPAFGLNFRFPFQCAVKTGTTKDYKDNWAVGYTTRYTVGVWVGNFNGEEMHHVSGVSGAGPIFTDIMMYLHTLPYGQPPADFTVPECLIKRSICTRSGKKPTPVCKKTISEWFYRGQEPKEECKIHQEYIVGIENGIKRKRIYEIFPGEYRQWAASEGIPSPLPGERRAARNQDDVDRIKKLAIVTPNNGDYYKIDPILRQEYQTITIAGFIPKGFSNVTLRVNGNHDIPFDISGMQWQLQKGIFRFQLCGYQETKEVKSNPVVINVE